MSKPVGFRFMRCFDVIESRMVNVWLEVMTEEEYQSFPVAVECGAQARTPQEVLDLLGELKYPLLGAKLVDIAKKCMEHPRQVNPDKFVHL